MAGFLSKLTGGNEPEENFNNEEIFDTDINYSVDEIIEDNNQISLSIDAFEDEDNIYIKAFIPSVEPKDIDIDISRDTVTISGERSSVEEISNDQYFQKELSWGKFSKRILLPKEIDIENIKASAHNGTLTLKLPKTDKDRKVKVKIGG
ncbi:hypothetical protein CSB11_02195 [Candidatus Campbellbacteria bacterium]|nr:MAG: hypothetical protein CSB11_02195 [Candidatus Campbellbacteria bacterium]